MHILVLAIAQPIERISNKMNTELNVYCVCQMCRRYLQLRHFVLFRVPIYLAFSKLVVRWQVLGNKFSTRLKIKKGN